MVSLMEFALRGMFLVLSMYGYLQFLRKRVRVELAIPLLFSSIGAVMFLAGMQNMLQEMTLLIFGTGLYLSYRSVRQKESPFTLLTPGVCFFLMGCAFLVYLIYGTRFYLFDDFSHWGTVAKAIAQYDRFPNASNIDVTYTSYPLGSASFIYYITKILGISSEWIQCYAQAVLALGMAVSIFAFSSGVYGVIFAAAVSVFMLVSNMPLTCLCVDTLLPMITLAAFAFCLYYREDLRDKVWYLLPHAIFLISIKNSGILFAVFIYLYMAYCFRKSGISLQVLLVHILLAAAVLLLWQKHVKLVYADGMMSRHSLSLSYCASVLTEKTPEEIWFTIRCFLENTFSLSNTIVYLFGIGFPLLLISGRVLKIDMSSVKQVYAVTVLLYGIYQIGLIGMYLFNMPPSGEPLPSYERYHDSMVAFSAGLFSICILSVLSQIRSVRGNHAVQVLLAAVSIAVAFYVLDPGLQYYVRNTYAGEDRESMDALIEEYHIEKDRRYFIVVSDDRVDNGYLHLMTWFLLEPRDVQMCTPESLEGWLEYNCLRLYDYYILFDETPETVAFFEETFQTSERVLCTSKY